MYKWSIAVALCLMLHGRAPAQKPSPEPTPAAIRVAQTRSPAGQAFNPLYGVRSTGPVLDSFQPQAIGYNNRGSYWGDDTEDPVPQIYIYHQPLIQVKVRIIEVVREDNLAAKTVLDYIRDRNAASLINTHTVNTVLDAADNVVGAQRTTTSTRFPDGGLLNIPALTEGNGGIINVTSNHLNIIGEFLATEFKADLITCPQVVTLNGQKVQLLSGANVPFRLGQSVLHDGTLAVQDTFYKHVGTDLTVTPRIVNWGPRGEGVGQRPIMVRDVLDWNAVAGMMHMEELFEPGEGDDFKKYIGNKLLMRFEDQRNLLDVLNRHSRASLIALLKSRVDSNPGYPYPMTKLFRPLDCNWMGESGCPCEWNPSDCTLDIELVLRQSQEGSKFTPDLTGNTDRAGVNLTNEEVGAAIANVVQVQNGHGAVIAGLIGKRDIRRTWKVPVLGDIPVVGAGFRSTATNRQKTEIVIFVEAEILPSEPYEGVAQAAQDFDLTRSYLHGDVLCNPLEAAMQRAGFGSYLPPRSYHEKIYWERLGRKVQKSCTAVHDIVR